MDEVQFKVAFNDVDYGYRLTQAGYRNIYCATAVLKHHESATRGLALDVAEVKAIHAKWGQWTDPYLSPYLLADPGVRLRAAAMAQPAGVRGPR